MNISKAKKALALAEMLETNAEALAQVASAHDGDAQRAIGAARTHASMLRGWAQRLAADDSVVGAKSALENARQTLLLLDCCAHHYSEELGAQYVPPADYRPPVVMIPAMGTFLPRAQRPTKAGIEALAKAFTEGWN